MTEALPRVLEHLERLVAFDTRNPPRAIDTGGIFNYLHTALTAAGLRCDVADLGDGCIYLLATRGDPHVLINVHIDTVPADPNWQQDPHRLVVTDDRAIGLGACDIKGAAACLLAQVGETRGPVALLFSSDEEAGSSRCVHTFLARHRFAEVVVAEPTRSAAVLEHRGIGTATLNFTGVGGHASSARALQDSAVHEAVRWAARALEHASTAETAASALPGLRLNIGAIEGGLKANMIAATTTVRLGVRPPPELPPQDALARLVALAPDPTRVRMSPGFLGPPLPACGPAGLAAARAAGAALAARHAMPLAAPVDFWTEAALFSAAGATTLVFGPGDIAQAHTAGEYVALSELAAASSVYRRILS